MTWWMWLLLAVAALGAQWWFARRARREAQKADDIRRLLRDLKHDVERRARARL